jgi:hypothetical protein
MVDEESSPECRPSVREDEELWIGVVPQHVKWDSDGSCRPNSATFLSKTRDISVFLASRTTPERCMRLNRSWAGLAAVPAALVIGLGHPVVEDPQPGNPAHAEILGRITKSHRKELARAARWVMIPKGPGESAWR